MPVALLGPLLVRALHVNYGLRAEADGDEHHCVVLCDRLEVELEVVRAERSSIDCGAHAPVQAPGNLQAWARQVRYAEADRMAREARRADRDRAHGE